MVSGVRRIGRVALGSTLLVASMARADGDRGWSFLIDKLAGDGVPRARAEQVFRDDRVDPFDGLQFSLRPRESPSLYRSLRTRGTAARARLCLMRYASSFEAAEQRFGVPANVVASIIQVESACGVNTGRSRILPALARLAMAAEPQNLERNVDRLTLLSAEPAATAEFTRWRARHLEDMFYPELRATFEIAERLNVDPLEMRGSGSGAFGIPQFLPRSYLWYGVDGDGDGHVSLYHPVDAIPSCAHYLQQYGWRSELSRAQRRNVIWGYNHSDAYIDTVLWLADEVKSPSPEPPPPPRTAAKRARPAPRARAKTPSRSKTAAGTKAATRTTAKKSPPATTAQRR